MFYLPIIPYYIYQAIRARSMTFYLVTNPAIHYSGNGTESKYKTIMLVPEKYRPKSVLLEEFEEFQSAFIKIKNAQIEFPLIAKPDLGFRGLLVKKINNEQDLKQYINKNNSIALLIQEFVAYKNECGILYHRIPNETQGKITSITLKKFLTVFGDGISNLTELILNDKRAFLYYDLLKNIHKENMSAIPKKDEKIVLTVIGNHSKGTQFLNGNHLISKKLELSFDKLNKQIDGWFFGRLDIKYNDFEDLLQGENYKVLEINGIISEPTHVYDASIKGATYWKALRTIQKNWKVITTISRYNHKHLKLKYPKLKPYLNEIKFLRVYSWKIKKLNKRN
jgi:hypothetical protein